MAQQETFYGTGRRKTAIARVYLKPGSGKFQIVNRVVKKDARRELGDYFPVNSHQALCMAPLEATNNVGRFDVYVNVRGGGLNGQASAIRHGLTRALMSCDPELRKTLKEMGFVTRDARIVERKKYGLAGARRRFQYSKR